jgi:peptide deformylase
MEKRKYFKSVIVLVILLFAIIGCTIDGFKKQEIAKIMSKDEGSVLSLLTINDQKDSLFLRQVARKISKVDVVSSYMERLKQRMLRTVTDSINRGVGIAAPQVGIGVQLICIQRFDKNGEPFEVYFNPRIEQYGDSINSGMEGCLSVPGYRGKVDRSHNIELSYLDSTGKKQKETVNGYTAVIFQHEIDHLNGILYFDHVYGGFKLLTKVEGN